VKPAKTRKTVDDAKAMAGYVSLFASMEDAAMFEKAVLGTSNTHLPPCARLVKEGAAPSSLYWRWLAVTAEAWS
jgi:hypothetical protein